MEFIDIREVQKKPDEYPRKSHFNVYPDYLEVSGELPHCYRFKPDSITDAVALIKWLSDWIAKNTI